MTEFLGESNAIQAQSSFIKNRAAIDKRLTEVVAAERETGTKKDRLSVALAIGKGDPLTRAVNRLKRDEQGRLLAEEVRFAELETLADAKMDRLIRNIVLEQEPVKGAITRGLLKTQRFVFGNELFLRERQPILRDLPAHLEDLRAVQRFRQQIPFPQGFPHDDPQRRMQRLEDKIDRLEAQLAAQAPSSLPSLGKLDPFRKLKSDAEETAKINRETAAEMKEAAVEMNGAAKAINQAVRRSQSNARRHVSE